MPQDPVATGNAVSSWITDNGVATVLLFAVLLVGSLALWKFASWSAGAIWIPIRDRFFSHLDDLKIHLQKSDETMNEFQGSLKSFENTLVGLNQTATQIADSQKMLHAKVDEIGKQKCKAG